jgi:LmbE family N-acetylglucosaminyl deacetylase
MKKRSVTARQLLRPVCRREIRKGMNPYHQFVAEYARLVKEAKAQPLGTFEPVKRPKLPESASKVLLFAPHPDDECIVGGLALRLLREAGMNVLNVAVTQGSKKGRQAERYEELQKACRYLGFGLLPTGPNGLEKISPNTRRTDPVYWEQAVEVIRRILQEQRPKVILFPHDQDWNSTHIGTHYLVMDALNKLPRDFECYIVETEFWGQMSDPNLMAEINENDLAELVTATTFHAGEVQRNPYHVLLPAWMTDNVRRGSELVGGQGGAAPDFTFATLYRFRKWTGGAVTKLYEGGKQISKSVNVGDLFP